MQSGVGTPPSRRVQGAPDATAWNAFASPSATVGVMTADEERLTHAAERAERIANFQALALLGTPPRRGNSVQPQRVSQVDEWMRAHPTDKKSVDASAVRYSALDGRGGGRWAVRPRDFDSLAHAVVQDFQTGNNPACLSELGGTVFKAFVDLDYTAPNRHELPRMADIQSHLVVISDVVAAAFPQLSHEQRSVVLCTGNEYQKGAAEHALHRAAVAAGGAVALNAATLRPDDSPEPQLGKWKHGVHLVWPGISATAETMASLAVLMRHKLKATFPVAPGGDSWDEIVDSAVYRAPCLRLPWTYKCLHCPCRNRRIPVANRERTCPLPNCFRGRVHDVEAGVYKPRAVLNGKMADSGRYSSSLRKTQRSGMPYLHTMRLVSLWVKATPDMEASGPRRNGALVAQPVSSEPTPFTMPRKVSEALRVDLHTAVQAVSGVKKPRAALPPGDSRHAVLLSIVRRYKQCYKSVHIAPGGVKMQAWTKGGGARGAPPSLKDVKAGGKKSTAMYTVSVEGTGARHCGNRLGGPHTKSTVYFLITPKHCVQKCFSWKQGASNRIHGCCARFSGEAVPLLREERLALFGQDTTQRVPSAAAASSGGTRLVSAVMQDVLGGPVHFGP